MLLKSIRKILITSIRPFVPGPQIAENSPFLTKFLKLRPKKIFNFTKIRSESFHVQFAL